MWVIGHINDLIMGTGISYLQQVHQINVDIRYNINCIPLIQSSEHKEGHPVKLLPIVQVVP